MTSTPSITDTYRPITNRLPSLAGFLVAYVVAGAVTSFLVAGGSPDSLEYALTNEFMIGLWPLSVFVPTFWLSTAVGLLVGFGVLAGLEASRLPLSAPRRLPTPSLRFSGEAIAAVVVAEIVARYTTAAAFVAHLHVWSPHRGEPELSVAFYRDALAFFDRYVGDLPYLVWAGNFLPEAGALPSGGPDQNSVLRGIGEVQFFDGVGFALLVGYFAALVLSYVVVRKASSWLVSRPELSLAKGT